MIQARRIFWPYVVTALLVVVFSGPRVFGNFIFWGRGEPRYFALGALFVPLLLVLATLRSRLASRLPDSLALAACSLPFLAALLLADSSETDGAWVVSGFIDRYALGALFSLGLVLAEVVTLSRFTGGTASGGLMRGLLYALPFQLPWIVRAPSKIGEWFDREYYWDRFSNFLDWSAWPPSVWTVPLFALVLIPLSLRRGGSKTPSVMLGLAVATVLVFVQRELEFVNETVHFVGCTPATHFEILEGFIGELGFGWLEAIRWGPAVVAAATLVLWRKRAAAGVAAVTLIFGAHELAIARFDHLIDPLTKSQTADFIPRGRGTEFSATKIGRKLIDDEVALDAWFAEQAPRRRVAVAFDARTTAEQELRVAIIARRNGIQALEVVEGEDRGEAGSRFLLSTHLRRLLAKNGEVTFFLGAGPRWEKTEGTRSNLSLKGLHRNQNWVLELPEE